MLGVLPEKCLAVSRSGVCLEHTVLCPRVLGIINTISPPWVLAAFRCRGGRARCSGTPSTRARGARRGRGLLLSTGAQASQGLQSWVKKPRSADRFIFIRIGSLITDISDRGTRTCHLRLLVQSGKKSVGCSTTRSLWWCELQWVTGSRPGWL